MQELEKILQEIKGMLEENKVIELNGDGTVNRCIIGVDLAWGSIKSIVRKHMTDSWIPVEERLPENAKHKGTFCPKYQVDTKYGVTEGWYNPDVKSWYCLFWFMTKRYLELEIDFVKGDVPKVVRVPLESDIVIAWRPLPEPYRPERGEGE